VIEEKAMDDDSGPTISRGGAIEPVDRAAIDKERFQAAKPEGLHYEFRDPFAEVTYRARTFDDMVAKAEQLGAHRFYAVGEDGKRTPINKVNGVWQQSKGPLEVVSSASIQDKVRRPEPTPLTQVVKASEAAIARVDANAERAARAERLEATLAERYIIRRALKAGDITIGQTEYRYRGDPARVAFTETVLRLTTDSDNPSVARSMVDVAEARNWRVLRVSGHDAFRRLIWIEASLRGVKALGYSPQQADIEQVRREREARQVNRVEPVQSNVPSTEGKQSARGSGGRKAVLAALEAVLLAKRVPERQREAVMAAAAENLARRLAAGEIHKVKVYDRAAEPQRPIVRPSPEQQRARERAAPTR
jgi:Large polyvalent protein-associated domain 7